MLPSISSFPCSLAVSCDPQNVRLTHNKQKPDLHGKCTKPRFVTACLTHGGQSLEKELPGLLSSDQTSRVQTNAALTYGSAEQALGLQ